MWCCPSFIPTSLYVLGIIILGSTLLSPCVNANRRLKTHERRYPVFERRRRRYPVFCIKTLSFAENIAVGVSLLLCPHLQSLLFLVMYVPADPAPPPLRPKRMVIASSRLLDPENAAQPESIRSHQRAIEAKRAAESADNQPVQDATHGTQAQGSSGDLADQSSQTSSSLVPCCRSRDPSVTSNSNFADRVGGDSSDNDGDSITHRMLTSTFLAHFKS